MSICCVHATKMFRFSRDEAHIIKPFKFDLDFLSFFDWIYKSSLACVCLLSSEICQASICICSPLCLIYGQIVYQTLYSY